MVEKVIPAEGRCFCPISESLKLEEELEAHSRLRATKASTNLALPGGPAGHFRAPAVPSG